MVIAPRTILLLAALLPILFDCIHASAISHEAPTLPLIGAGFVGRALTFTDDELSQLAGAPATKRIYAIDGREVMVLSVDSAGDRHVAHDPSYCLAARGWRLVDRQACEASRGAVSLELFEREGKQLTVAFFHDLDGRWTTSALRYLAAFLRVRCDPAGGKLRFNVVQIDGTPPSHRWVVERVIGKVF